MKGKNISYHKTMCVISIIGAVLNLLALVACLPVAVEESEYYLIGAMHVAIAAIWTVSYKYNKEKAEEQ